MRIPSSMQWQEIRLGYLMSYNDELIDNISLQLPEWNVSTVAQRARNCGILRIKIYEGAHI